jgi:hypothetical protein
MSRVTFLTAAILLLFSPGATGRIQDPATEGILLRLDGAYLAYSYDLGRIYGERVTFRLDGFEVACGTLKIDISSRTFLAVGRVILTKDGMSLEFDELLFEPGKTPSIGFLYGEEIKVQSFPDGRPLSEAERRTAAERKAVLDDLTPVRIRESLISSTARSMEITPAYEVYGSDVVMFVEGLKSVGFARFKISLGEKQRTNGFSLDKIWFNRTQGLFANAGYAYDRDNVIRSLTQARYEEHSILKSYGGLPRQLDLQTSTTWTAAEGLDLGLDGNYNSTGLWNARLSADRKFKEDRGRVLFDLAFNKPLGRPFEAWLGGQASLRLKSAGTLNVSGKADFRAQSLATAAYALPIGKHFRFDLNAGYSQLRFGGLGGTSKIFTGNFNFSYQADLLTAAAEYYLNRDLVGNQRLSRPQLRFGLRPFSFYGGLLTASLQTVFLANDLQTPQGRSRTYSDNTAFSLSTRPIRFRPDLSLQVTAALEQFLEKEGRNFTSGGFIFQSVLEITPTIALEGFYSLQSRRRSRSWLIEGTTSQDLSAMLRINPEERLNGWVTVSYDPKAGMWTQGFADLAVGLIRNWEFQTLFNYDFERRTVANVDLYLIRHAGRLDLRLIWRSLSKQILIELIPSLGSARTPPGTGKSSR